MAYKILIVDDEVDVLKILIARLNAADYVTVTADKGDDVIPMVEKESPDLIILDVMLPPPNGYQVCRSLKDDPKYSHIPIILLTVKSTESDRFWGEEAGADAYITKPYNADELLEEIKKTLK